MTNRTTIINKSLLLIGEEMISSEGDGSKNSDIASELIDICIETALSEHDWLFARKRVIVALSAETPPFGYEYKFLLPDDFNHIVVEDGDEFVFREEGGYLLSESDELELLYVANITNLELFPPKFEDAVVTLLASKMAYAITGSPQVAAGMEQLYEKRLVKAKWTNAGAMGTVPEDDTWVEDR